MYLQVLCTCVASLSLQRVELLFDFEVDNWLVRFLKHIFYWEEGVWSRAGAAIVHLRATFVMSSIFNEMSFFFLFLFQLYFWTRLPRLRWNGHDIRLVRKQLRLGWVDFSNSYKIFVSNNNIHSGLSESVRLYMKGRVTIDIRRSSWLNVWRKIIQNRYYSGIHLWMFNTHQEWSGKRSKFKFSFQNSVEKIMLLWTFVEMWILDIVSFLNLQIRVIVCIFLAFSK